MSSFEQLYARAAERKGGAEALEALIPKPKSDRTLARIGDDRWLSEMTKRVFQAGFNWKVVENKWPGFEVAFEGFDPLAVAAYSDDDLDVLMKDKRVIRQWRKLKATRHNAQFIVDLAQEHGSAAKYFAQSPSSAYVDLLGTLKARAAWLGGTTAQYFLRGMGKDSFILSTDVVKALQREKVITGSHSSKSALKDIQQAFDQWLSEGGESLTRISRVLAFTVGE